MFEVCADGADGASDGTDDTEKEEEGSQDFMHGYTAVYSILRASQHVDSQDC